jgi:radical SAM protein with 4Fe4S-binding SPASM domain
MIVLDDAKYHYRSIFDSETGRGIRSNVYDEKGNDTGHDPFMGSFPELIDIGIMGWCAHGKSGLCLKSGVECYQNGPEIAEANMPFPKYKKIIDECRGRTFQVALGGRGDPDMHEEFLEILKYTRENGVVPNFTTSGFGLEEKLLPAIKKYCGAVAVSWYRNEYTAKALDMFLTAGIRTNIHYCLSSSTIDEAIEMIEKRKYPEKINRIIFLLHKPVGLGSQSNVLKINDERVKHFFSLFDRPETVDKAGFDSCSVPALLAFADKIHPMCIEACEAGRFSAYISPDYKLSPCSFEKDPNYSVSLNDSSIEAAWNSKVFESFREKQKNKCPSCPKLEMCFGGCPVKPEITLCQSEYRRI